MFKKCLLILVLAACINSAFAQDRRFLDQVFSSTTKNTIIYGYNTTILTVPITGNPTYQPLVADVYHPTGDTSSARPLVLFLHSGNFLPFPQNRSVSGTRSDSSAVNICERLAKMGYVAVSADYRLGWDPANPNQNTRINTLINAAYRGVQDANTAVRFFKLNASTFGIDTNKIVLFGQGTGGYLSLNTGSLDKYVEIVNTCAPTNKFIDAVSGLPMVLEPINGNLSATTYGIVPMIGSPLDGDTLCHPNNIGPTNKVQMLVNLGGALGDTCWMDVNTPSVISFQVPSDPFAPYTSGILIVPGVNFPVVEVQGSYFVQKKAKDLALNAKWRDKVFIDPISIEAKRKNHGFEGLFPLYRPNPYDSAPWEYWASTNPNDSLGRLTNPDMSKLKATKFIDTILTYFAPRACIELDLGCNLEGFVASRKIISPESVGLLVAPNPASSEAKISTKDEKIKSIRLYDAAGRNVKVYEVNNTSFIIDRSGLPAGLYIAQTFFEKGVSNVKFIFD